MRVFNNAKAFNHPESVIYSDAVAMEHAFRHAPLREEESEEEEEEESSASSSSSEEDEEETSESSGEEE